MPTYAISVSCPFCHRVTATIRVNGKAEHWTCACGQGQTVSITLDLPPLVRTEAAKVGTP